MEKVNLNHLFSAVFIHILELEIRFSVALIRKSVYIPALRWYAWYRMYRAHIR